MRMNKQKTTLSLSIAVLLVVACVSTAFAATSGTTPTTVGIQGGSLTITAPAVTTDFGNVSLASGSTTANAALGTLAVTDATGTGSGYKVNVQASQFTEVTPGGGYAGATSAKLLPLSSLKVAPPTGVSAVGGTTSALPTSVIAANTVIDSGSAVKILSAAVNEGMGSYNVSFPANSLVLAIDVATAQVDATNYPAVATPYSSTITWTIVTGP
jgi:hypothetical protein